MLETRGPCSYIQLRDNQLCMVVVERGGASLFKKQTVFTSLPSRWTSLVQQEDGRGPFPGLTIAGTGNAASIALCRLGEARLLSMAPFSRPHTQQHSEAHAV